MTTAPVAVALTVRRRTPRIARTASANCWCRPPVASISLVSVSLANGVTGVIEQARARWQARHGAAAREEKAA